jgi:hypothetical protein
MRLRTVVPFMLLLVAGSAAAQGKKKIAVLGIEPLDDTKTSKATTELAVALTEGLRLKATQNSTFVAASNARKELTEVKLLSNCIEEEPDCLGKVGDEMGADVLLYGHLQKTNNGYDVDLQVLNIKPKPTLGKRARVSLAAKDTTAANLKDKVSGDLVNEALDMGGTVAPTGDVELVVMVTGATEGTVIVNGMRREPIKDGKATFRLPPGEPVSIVVEAPGMTKGEQQIERLEKNQSVTVTLQKGDIIKKPIQAEEVRPGGGARILFWTSLALTGAGVTVFTITGLKVRSLEDEQDELIAAWPGGGPDPVMNPDDACAEAAADGYTALVNVCDDGKSMATITNIAIGVTIAAGIASAFFYWRGYIAADKTSEKNAAAKKRRQGTTWSVAPTLYPSGGGLGAVISF